MDIDHTAHPHDIDDDEEVDGAESVVPGGPRARPVPRARQLRVVAWQAARLLLVVVLAAVPPAAALVAIAVAPPARLEIAGAPVAVKPVLGQDTSRLQNGALIRPEHAHLALLGTDVGVDIDADWNKLIPRDKATRTYLEALWNDPQPEFQRIRDAARHYLVVWGLAGFGAGAVAVGGVLVVLAERRRRMHSYTPSEARLVREHNRRLRRTSAVAAVVLAVAVDGAGAAVLLDRDHHVVVSNPAFQGTTLQGTEADGLVSDILPFLSILQPRSGFYDTVAAHLQSAIADEPGLQPSGDRVTFVLAEDFEDVNGMARQVGLAARLVDADFLMLTGDITFAGKPVETYLIDTVNYYAQDRPVYFAPGIHDTDTIVQAARSSGWHVADGTTQTVDGLTLLTEADPRISTIGDFGTADILRDPDVDVDRFVADTVHEACRTRPDFVVLHDHLLGRQVAQAGCQRRAVLDGRSYQFLGPQSVPTSDGGHSLEYTSGSAGGHVTTTPDPGDIRHPARFSVLTCDPDGRHLRYFVITVQPDASVTVTPGIALHVPYDEYLHTGHTGRAVPVGGAGSG